MNYTNVEHVSAGQIAAGQNQSLIYQAYLGTCLGLALYDKSTKTGGIIHILLPEPPGFSPPDFQEKYASTGVPLLIKQMIDMGASVKNIEATIAGGALVGPISQQDMNLDIGGRSLEITDSLLKASGIKTISSETGGFFTCSLELNMDTGETTIKPAFREDFTAQHAFAPPSMNDISATIDQLQPVPQSALKIFRMFHSGQSNINDITNELVKDQVLSAQTLKLCNSAIFSGRIKIDTLKDAVLLLGENMLIKSVITAAMNNYYSQAGTSGYSLCKGGLFFHAVGVAATAEIIAEKCDSPYKKVAYTAGLLHDIGKVVLDQYVADSSPLLFRKLGQKKMNFMDAEKKTIGITHCEAGGILAKKWHFSDDLSHVIQFHHTPEKTQKNKELTYLIYLADLIVEKFITGFEVEQIQTDSLGKALRNAGLKPDDLHHIVDLIPVSDILNIDTFTSKKQS